jgi:hypothetical protein
MNTAFKPLSWALVLMAASGIAAAQETPPAVPATPAPSTAAVGGAVKAPAKSTAQIDAGEPRANTSSTSPGSPVPGPGGPADTVPRGTPATAAPAGTPAPRNPPRAVAAGRAPASAGQKAPGIDRLELGTATVTGDHEQPKVMYIVPWKKSDIGDLSGKPMNSLLDEALAPIDRDEFKREVAYYDVVKSDASQNGAPNPASKQGEK